MAGIKRLLSMRTPRGGFGVWPGEYEPVPWGTAYVVHTLLDAKRLGYAVPQEVIDDALRYLESEVDRAERGEAQTDFKYGLPPARWEPYVHYVLALGGKPRKARALKLAESYGANLKGSEAEEAYLVKAAVYLGGDRRYMAALKAPDVSPPRSDRSLDYSYYSDVRSRGMLLNAFHQMFGTDASGLKLADVVAEALADKRAYLGTQEVSWGVSGLGRWVSGKRGGLPTPTLLANGKKVALDFGQAKVVAGQPAGEPTWALARASEYKTLQLLIPPELPERAFLILSSTGVRQGGDYQLGGEGLRIERVHRSLSGEALDTSRALGDLVFSEITIENQSNVEITNIAVVDRFPAGWEIENPRLGRGVQVDWVKPEELWQPEYLDVRDDNLQVFGRLQPHETKKIVYSLRAVTAGQFTLPPVEASAMYHPKYWARAAGGKVSVAGAKK